MSTIHSREENMFNECGGNWWNNNAEYKALLAYNKIRIPFLENSMKEVMNKGIKNSKILDVGCGGGYLSFALAEKGGLITGIDIARDLIQAAKDHAKALQSQGKLAKFLPNPQFHHIEITKTPPQFNQNFDAVIASEVIEHVANPDIFVKKCTECLKPNGVVVFTTPNRTWASYLVIILMSEYVLRMMPKGTHTYNQFIKPSELEKLCNNAGMEKVSLQGAMYFPWPINTWYNWPSVSVLYMMSFRKKFSK